MDKNFEERAKEILSRHLTKYLVETQGCYPNLAKSIAEALRQVSEEAERRGRSEAWDELIELASDGELIASLKERIKELESKGA